MTVLASIARSRTVAALTSPHGVDHHLAQVFPMWAAHEVRGRVVAMQRETETAGAPVVTPTVQPTATGRGHRAGQYVQVGLDLPGSAPAASPCRTGSLRRPPRPRPRPCGTRWPLEAERPLAALSGQRGAAAGYRPPR